MENEYIDATIIKNAPVIKSKKEVLLPQSDSAKSYTSLKIPNAFKHNMLLMMFRKK